MPYTTEILDDGKIIMMTMDKDFDFNAEFTQFCVECADILDKSPHPVVVLTDGSNRPVKDLNDILQGGSITRKPEGQRFLKHPKALKVYNISSNRIVHLTIKGLNTATFGFFEIPIFETVDEALTAARLLLEAQSKTANDK